MAASSAPGGYGLGGKPAPKDDILILRECLARWEQTVSDLRGEIQSLKTLPKDERRLQAVSAKLGSLCMDADAWAFDQFYQITWKAQELVLDLRTGIAAWKPQSLDILLDALTMLSGILVHCERDFQLRKSTTSMLRFLSPEPDSKTGHE